MSVIEVKVLPETMVWLVHQKWPSHRHYVEGPVRVRQCIADDRGVTYNIGGLARREADICLTEDEAEAEAKRRNQEGE